MQKIQGWVLFILLLSILNIGAQNLETNLKTIHTLIELDSLQKAESAINSNIQHLKETKNYEALSHYIFIIGKIDVLRKDFNKASFNSNELLVFISQHTSNSKTLYLANLEYSKLCLDVGNLPRAYKFAEKAKAFAKKTSNPNYLLESEYYLADYSMKLGQINVLKKHILKAENILKNNPNKEFKITARVYNLLGALMFFSSKQDSALHYFDKALKYIPNLEENAENKFYLPAAIQGNMALIKLNQGKPSEAKPLIQSSIKLSKGFLSNSKNHPLENRVKRNLIIGFSTLNGLHFDLGDFEKANLISDQAYNYTKKHFPENSQEFFMAALTLAEVKIQKRDTKSALHFLEIAKNSLEKISGDNFQLKAFLNGEYANVYYMNKEFEKALEYRESSNINYTKSNPNSLDPNKLYNTMNLAISYSEIGKKDKAIKTTKDIYNYILKTKGEQDYFTNALMLTFSRVYFNLKMYQESLNWSNKSIKLYNENASKQNIDKIYFEENKAEIYSLNAQAKYYLTTIKDSLFLKSLLPIVDAAIEALKERKTTITSFNDVSNLIEDNKKVFSFAKKINLELYNLTHNISYLENTINLHESALYNRIRARLNANPNISFSGIPKHIATREKTLLQALKNKDTNVDSITTNTYKWHTFLDTLKTQYPKYYKMRYAIIEKPINKLYHKTPENTTVIRYLFIDENLYAFVLSSKEKSLIKLNSDNLEDSILKLSKNQFNIENTSTKLFKLYQELWQPIKNKITTDKVIIIPDGYLFNLSFESLTPNKISTFKDLATNSLLAKHNISYNYSLLLIGNKKVINYDKDFIAFAPEFNAKMKKDYSITITDSISIDKTYLSLLPQPFSVDLAKEYSKYFNGNYFINENASKQVFKNEANEHKIIHIGTHAESNNITPELSRLIFAKTNKNQDNSLYTYEIYNQSLNSNLAILTACETGKPTYQAGEGMISLAHAFNYAGSESILTSLWKIDEKSSAKIVELFFENIKKGMSKDVALKNAKLSYIAKAKGRIISPEYWAGLVLIGDTTPIALNSSSNLLYWVIIICIVLLILVISLRTKRK
ncbi:CHAT domain-containing protein [Seonamhaeicola sp. NFXS20]|uniref:CHAT domain-containing protein n=1 Tax=Seonamhaeicola sp. NFXS20 TaxID=2816959 RepID=UPI003BA02797